MRNTANLLGLTFPNVGYDRSVGTNVGPSKPDKMAVLAAVNVCAYALGSHVLANSKHDFHRTNGSTFCRRERYCHARDNQQNYVLVKGEGKVEEGIGNRIPPISPGEDRIRSEFLP